MRELHDLFPIEVVLGIKAVALFLFAAGLVMQGFVIRRYVVAKRQGKLPEPFTWKPWHIDGIGWWLIIGGGILWRLCYMRSEIIGYPG